MKVNNLLKRIGSVVTTAAMLATLGTTGFAYNPTNGITDSGTDITINSVSVAPVTGATDVYKVTAGYTATKEQSVGVTMLTYAMTARDAEKSVSDVNITNVSTDGKVTSGAGVNMPIIGIDQNAKTVANGTGTFEFTFTTDDGNGSNKYYIAPGKTAIMFISGDNVSAKAAFSFNAPWTANKVEEVTFGTVNYTLGESDSAITDKVKAELDKHTSVTVKNSTDNSLSTTATAAYSNIVLDTANNKATASVAYSNAMAPEAILGVTSGSVEVALAGQKDTWTATNATVGKDNKISVAKNASSDEIIAAIRNASIVIDNKNGETAATKSFELTDKTEAAGVTIAPKGGETDKYTVTINGTYGGDTQEITASNLIIEVTVEFTENIASAVELVNGNTESATAYTWNKDNVSVKADAETDAAVSTAVKNKLGADGVYAKITYTNASTSGDQYEYVSANDFAYVATVADNKVTATVTKEGISITSGNTFDFGYTVTPVLDKLELSATTYNYTKQADNEENAEVIKNIKAELDKLTITEDEHTVKVADTEHTWTITFEANGAYTAVLKVTKFNDTTFDAWMPTVGYIEATVTGTISEKPAEAFTAKSFGADDKEVFVGTEKADVISSLPTTATAYANADKTGASATVNVENWTSSDYDASKIGEYTFTAAVPVQTQEGVVKVTEAGTVSVKVTTKAITVDATKTVTVNVPVGYTAETVANALPKKLTYTSGTLTDTVTVSWTAINAGDLGKADGATFTVTGTVNDKSDSKIFIFNPKAVKATVTVRNSVESNKAWELGNTGEYNAGTVKVYLPAGTTASETAPVKVVATLYKADGSATGATATATLKEAAESVDLTFDKSFNAAGIHANDKYTVKVAVAGTPLVYKDAENNDADSVQGTVYPSTTRRPSTGGGSTTPEVKSYNVSVKADNNGKATVNKTKATAGETVAVNVEPNEGYKVKEITVKDVNGKSIDVDQKTRTFEMPEGAVTVTVTFEEGTEEPTPDDKGKFKDVPDSFWAAADIYTLREAGIIDGKTADEFDPEGQVTRAEFTKMIVKMFGVEAKDTKVEFADCGEDDWFTPFVAAAVEAGYVKGYSDTEFAPDKVISREEACAILGRAYAKAANSELSFTDKDSIDEYAQPYVALLVEMGFINGYEDGTFRAQNHITRAEAAKIIGCAYRLATAGK